MRGRAARATTHEVFAGTLLLISVAFLFLAAPPAARAVILPPGFAEDILASGFQAATAIDFAPDGRLFVTEKQGTVWIVRDGVKLGTPFLDLRDEVHNAGDKGLLGIALDPNFASNGWVYVFYVVDPVFGAPDEPATAITFGRLARYTAVGDVANLGSRTILLGTNSADGFPNCAKIHGVGTIRFGDDGSLFVGCGDGAHANRVDFGQNLYPEDPGCEAMFGAALDVGAARSQLLTSLAGKILRIDPATGRGLPSNPFWNGDPNAPQSKVWVLGLRNPFRFTVMPGTASPGALLISEVGWTAWEELNVARNGGENFGWPCREGTEPQPAYTLNPRAPEFCAAMQGAPTIPILTWNHEDPGSVGFTGFASTGSVVYDATQFPVAYRGGVFFCDFGGEWIRFARLGANGAVTSVESFAFDARQPVELRVDPSTGDLVYVSIGPGKVHRITYAAGNVPPVAVAAAMPAAGPAPLDVLFSSSGTVDANGDAMTFVWDFGDGSAPSTEANPAHMYVTVGTWAASLVVRDAAGLADTAFVEVETRNTPPEVTLENPTSGQRFTNGELVPLLADATDREDGAAVDVRWEVQLVHNSHLHGEWFVWDGPAPPPFPCEDHASDPRDRYSYRVLVTATDDGGLSTTREAFLLPENLPANEAPVPDLRASTLRGNAPLPVYFDGTSSRDPDGDLLFSTWDFGDGRFGEGLTPSHVYGGYGEFEARLTLKDPILAEGSTTTSILVFPGRALEAHWNFDEGGGGAAIDASGHAHDGAIDGAAYAEGALGTALAFDAAGAGRVHVPAALLADRTAFTITAWVAPEWTEGEAGAGTIVSQAGAISFGFASHDTLLVTTATGGSVKAAYPYRGGDWHHVAAMGSGAGLTLAIDGRVVATGGFATFTYGTVAAPIEMGGGVLVEGADAPFRGRLDEVRIHGAALDSGELAFLGTHPRINHAPYVAVGGDQDLVVGTSVTLAANVTDDGWPAATQVTSAWSQVEGPVALELEDAAAREVELRFDVPGNYVMRCEATDGELSSADDVVLRVRAYGQAIELAGEAKKTGLESIGPNPARGDVAITFGVTRAASETRVTIVDVTGRALQQYPVAKLMRGRYRLHWDGRDADGLRAAPGVYFVIAEVGAVRTSGKVVLVR